MDQATLVREQIDGGERLIRQALASGFDVRAALWAKIEGDGQWYLYLVTPEVENRDPRIGYGKLAAVERGLERSWSHPLEQIDRYGVKLISPNHPLAQGVLEEYRRCPGP